MYVNGYLYGTDISAELCSRGWICTLVFRCHSTLRKAVSSYVVIRYYYYRRVGVSGICTHVSREILGR